jgi:DNA-binding ferritin-like protein
MKPDSAQIVIGLLQDRLNALNDPALTLKHVHWNVVGPNFIAVHTMLDPQLRQPGKPQRRCRLCWQCHWPTPG